MNDYKLAIKVADENQLREICAALMAERDALAAQVESAQALLKCWQTWLGASREQCDDTGEKLWDKIELVCSTPQQHLRELRAEAHAVGFISGVSWLIKKGDESVDAEGVEIAAKQYADSIRRGEVE